MINFTLIAKQEFERNLATSLEYQNSDVIHSMDIVRNMSLIAFTRFAKSSSLYFSLNHALSASIIGLQVLNAMRCRYGVVRPAQLLNLMASVLFCNIGIIRGVLDGDDGDRQRVSPDKSSIIENKFTDSILWAHKSFRSKTFIENISFLDTNINLEIVSRAIEYSDFSANENNLEGELGEIDKYARAIQIITLMSDQNYDRRLVEFYLSLKEAGLIDETIFSSLQDFRDRWVQYFWERLFPVVGEEILLLRETNEGRNIVSQMYSQL
ncbi:MAG: hypothetical protein ACKVIF_05290 [Rhodospirillales bacterium]|jgi:hypothetical protein